MVAAMEDWKTFREQTSFDHRALESLPSGERFGNYQIVREIGRGGMGVVFEAREEISFRRVAIKVLPFIQSPALRAGFEREARIATELRHPHIVPVYGCGEHQGTCFYVMQLIEGVSLDWIIQRLARREGVVSLAEVAAQFRSTPQPEIGETKRGPVPATAPPKTKFVSASNGSPSMQRLAPAAGLARSSWLEIARSPRRSPTPFNTLTTKGRCIGTSNRPICFWIAKGMCGLRISAWRAMKARSESRRAVDFPGRSAISLPSGSAVGSTPAATSIRWE